MIPIRNNDLKNICDHYCSALKDYIDKRANKKKKYWDDNIKKYFGKKECLESLIKADPAKLRVYKNIFENLNYKNREKITAIFKTFKTYYSYLTKDEVFIYKNKPQAYLAREIVEEIGIKVCPYCNRNFIFDTPKIRSSEFDHFYSQSKYPFLAISFYNLVPSCKVCNHGKKEKEKDIIHPYDSEYKFDKIEFDYEATGVGFLYDENQIKIELNSLDSCCNSGLDGSKDVFDLENIYQYHRDVVLELIQKREAYPEEYIKYLEGFCTDRNHCLRLITGNFVEEENLGKRPLTKLNRDIAKRLGFK